LFQGLKGDRRPLKGAARIITKWPRINVHKWVLQCPHCWCIADVLSQCCCLVKCWWCTALAIDSHRHRLKPFHTMIVDSCITRRLGWNMLYFWVIAYTYFVHRQRTLYNPDRDDVTTYHEQPTNSLTWSLETEDWRWKSSVVMDTARHCLDNGTVGSAIDIARFFRLPHGGGGLPMSCMLWAHSTTQLPHKCVTGKCQASARNGYPGTRSLPVSKSKNLPNFDLLGGLETTGIWKVAIFAAKGRHTFFVWEEVVWVVLR